MEHVIGLLSAQNYLDATASSAAKGNAMTCLVTVIWILTGARQMAQSA